jgi:hypothetical protein
MSKQSCQIQVSRVGSIHNLLLFLLEALQFKTLVFIYATFQPSMQGLVIQSPA